MQWLRSIRLLAQLRPAQGRLVFRSVRVFSWPGGPAHIVEGNVPDSETTDLNCVSCKHCHRNIQNSF